jgi:hypothetical protein
VRGERESETERERETERDRDRDRQTDRDRETEIMSPFHKAIIPRLGDSTLII